MLIHLYGYKEDDNEILPRICQIESPVVPRVGEIILLYGRREKPDVPAVPVRSIVMDVHYHYDLLYGIGTHSAIGVVARALPENWDEEQSRRIAERTPSLMEPWAIYDAPEGTAGPEQIERAVGLIRRSTEDFGLAKRVQEILTGKPAAGEEGDGTEA